jgi:hypothetical protein
MGSNSGKAEPFRTSDGVADLRASTAWASLFVMFACEIIALARFAIPLGALFPREVVQPQIDPNDERTEEHDQVQPFLGRTNLLGFQDPCKATWPKTNKNN